MKRHQIAWALTVLLGTGQLASAQTIDWTNANDELMRHFQALIRIDSQDPPGNETTVVNYIKQVTGLDSCHGNSLCGVED